MRSKETGPWDAVLEQIREWDPAWADACAKMTTNPWSFGVLPRPKPARSDQPRDNAACTNLNPDGTRRHIRAALEAGCQASRNEVIFFVLKAGSVCAIHSCSLGAPILLEEAKAAGATPTSKNGPPLSTEAATRCGRLDSGTRHRDTFFSSDPTVDRSVLCRPQSLLYKSGVLLPKEIELLSIACDASFTHMYRRVHTVTSRRR